LRKRLHDKLSEVHPKEELGKVYSSFDVIGDIAIIKIPPSNAANAKNIAKQIMVVHGNIKTVFTPASSISGDFRVRVLRLLAGENKTVTTHRESGCSFRVDVEKTYFSPRLSFEHKRIACLVKRSETVVNMFAGVGCFGIVIAKTVNPVKVYSIDVNPVAVECMKENVKVNHVEGSVFPILGDAKDIIAANLRGVADRVLMPLPEKALEYLPYALSALKPTGGWIHFYDFQHAPGKENLLKKTRAMVSQKLDSLDIKYVIANSRMMRPTGPNWYQTVLDIQVTELPNKF
jgi:tRNA (guanine37-N1)-methyltransferase